MLPNKQELHVFQSPRFMNSVLLEAVGTASGDRFLKYHKPTLWRHYHRQADGQIYMDLEKVKSPSLCIQDFPVIHHPAVQCNLP